MQSSSSAPIETLTLLLELGLQEKEVQVYMSALALGMAPVSIIADRAKLKRPTTSDVLKKMCDKGMAECFLKKRMRYYSVVSPRILYEKYMKHMEKFEKLLPQMMMYHHQLASRPRITYYEGRKEMERLYLDSLTAKHEAINYFRPDQVFGYFTKEWSRKHHIEERVRKKIRLRVLMPDGPWVEEYKKRSAAELRQFRVIHDEKCLFANEVYIYNNRMSIFSFDEDFGLLIESDDVVQTQKALFELAWESALVSRP